jgi:hypothetical protein
MQSYACLEKFVNEFNLLCLERGGFAQIQKIHSSPYYIYLSLRFAGLSQYVVVGRAFPFSYIGLHEKNVESDLRVKDKLLDWYRKVFRNKKLTKLSLDKERACIRGNFLDGEELIFSFIHKEPCWIYLYRDKDKLKYIDSIRMRAMDSDPGDFVYDIIAPADGKIDFKIQEYSSDSQRNTIHASLNKDNLKSKKKEERFVRQKRINILGDMSKLEKVISLKTKLIEHAVDLDLALKELSLQKKFKTEKTNEQKRDKLFKLIKRYEAGLAILKSRLNALDVGGEETSDNSPELVAALFPRQISFVNNEVKFKGGNAEKVEIQQYQMGKIKFAIGKSPQGNDHLRNRFGAKSDYWFHLEGEKGAHLVVKSQDLNLILKDYVDIFASILRDSSKLSITEIPLIFCQLSELKSVKGRAGAVIPKRPRYFVANYISNWSEIITDVG